MAAPRGGKPDLAEPLDLVAAEQEVDHPDLLDLPAAEAEEEELDLVAEEDLGRPGLGEEPDRDPVRPDLAVGVVVAVVEEVQLVDEPAH